MIDIHHKAKPTCTDVQIFKKKKGGFQFVEHNPMGDMTDAGEDKVEKHVYTAQAC